MNFGMPNVLKYELSKEVLKVEYDCTGCESDLRLFMKLHAMFDKAYTYLVAPPSRVEIRLLNTEPAIKPDSVCRQLVSSIHGQFGREFSIIQSSVDYRQGAAIHLDIHVKKGKKISL